MHTYTTSQDLNKHDRWPLCKYLLVFMNFVCVYKYVYKYIYMNIYVYIYINIYIYIYIHKYICIFIYIYICKYIHIRIHWYLCFCICFFSYSHAYVTSQDLDVHDLFARFCVVDPTSKVVDLNSEDLNPRIREHIRKDGYLACLEYLGFLESNLSKFVLASPRRCVHAYSCACECIFVSMC